MPGIKNTTKNIGKICQGKPADVPLSYLPQKGNL